MQDIGNRQERHGIALELERAADAQEDFEEILLTLWERMRAYSPADEVNSPCGVHYRLYEVLTALEDALLERDLITTEVIPTRG